MKDYEETYERFWKDIVENNQGELILDQVKRELHDYSILLENVPKVYDHVTGGVVSKPHTDASIVCQKCDEYHEEFYADIYKDLIEED